MSQIHLLFYYILSDQRIVHKRIKGMPRVLWMLVEQDIYSIGDI